MIKIIIITSLGVIIIPCITGFILILHTCLIQKKQKNKLYPHPAILFHAISQHSTFEQSGIDKKLFQQFIHYLHTHQYTTYSVADAVRLRNKALCSKQHFRPSPPSEFSHDNSITIVFDDGFEDCHSIVLPILAEYGFTATFFIIAGYCGHQTSQWDIYTNKRHLCVPQIRDIVSQGHEIGSHSLTHAALSFLNQQALRYELSESKKRLEDITGRAITSLSFPFGSYTTRVWQEAQELGYTQGVAYRGHAYAPQSLLPSRAVYKFETLSDIIEKITMSNVFAPVHVWTRLMPLFAQGTPIWKFRAEYNILHSIKTNLNYPEKQSE